MSAPLDRVLEHDAWVFWSGEAWVPDSREARVLFHGAPIMSVRWNAFLGAYTALYSSPLTDSVVMRTAPALTGPWSRPRQLFVADHGAPEGWTYDAIDHGPYEEDGGRVIYVTYSRPTGETWFSTRFPLVRVEVALP